MAGDELRHAAEQETLDTSSPVRTNDDKVSTPLRCGIEDALSDVTNLDCGVHLEAGTAQLRRNSLDQFTRWLPLNFQLRSVVWRHLRRSQSDWLQHVQHANFRILSSKLRDNSP